MIISKSWLVLFETTIDGVEYSVKSPNDTINNTLFFFYDNDKSFQLDAERLEFHKGISEWYFKFPDTAISVYNSIGKSFEYKNFIVTNNYYLFPISANGSLFHYICVLFRDSLGVKKCEILPLPDSYSRNHENDISSTMWCSYYDEQQEFLVTEERLAYYNTGPYLVTVWKIEKDTLIHIGERINNHENFKRFRKKENCFVWMLKDEAQKIMLKKTKR